MKKKENKEKYGYIKIEIPDYPKVEKVYCCDCVYYQEEKLISAGGTSQSYVQPEACLSEKVPNKTIEIDTYKCRMPIARAPSEINEDNNCIYFRKKK